MLGDRNETALSALTIPAMALVMLRRILIVAAAGPLIGLAGVLLFSVGVLVEAIAERMGDVDPEDALWLLTVIMASITIVYIIWKIMRKKT